MNRETHLQLWDLMRQRHGITLRCIEALPPDSLDSHPIRDMRTPRELVVHIYGANLKAFAEGAVSGKIAEVDEKAACAGIRSKDQLIAYVKECWSAADRAARSMTDAQLDAMVSSPWGSSYKAFIAHGVLVDEFLHHRGQLYAYLRQLGIEPPMNWDFEHNAPEFQPKEHAKA